MRSALVTIVAVIAVQLAGPSASWAYQLQPISRVFAPVGSKATQSFEVTNDGAGRIALAVSFATLDRDEAYAETNRDASDEFLAYPAQMILEPGARQTVRVTWLGAPDPARELAYRIIVAQVPLERLERTTSDGAPPRGQMRVMLTYRGTLFIRPAKAAPKIELRAAAPATDRDGSPGLAITLENTGTAVGLVKTCTMRVASSAGGAEIALSPAELRNTRVLGGTRRRYVVPWPAGLARGPVIATGRCSVES
jgi:fimbrial chaperone protein